MSTATPYLGSKISLISKAGIRYEGILYTIDPQESTVALSKVRSFGTEERDTERPVAPRDEIYEYIIFRGSDIRDLHVCEPPKTQSQLVQQDPAIVKVEQAPVGLRSTVGGRANGSSANVLPHHNDRGMEKPRYYSNGGYYGGNYRRGPPTSYYGDRMDHSPYYYDNYYEDFSWGGRQGRRNSEYDYGYYGNSRDYEGQLSPHQGAPPPRPPSHGGGGGGPPGPPPGFGAGPPLPHSPQQQMNNRHRGGQQFVNSGHPPMPPGPMQRPPGPPPGPGGPMGPPPPMGMRGGPPMGPPPPHAGPEQMGMYQRGGRGPPRGAWSQGGPQNRNRGGPQGGPPRGGGGGGGFASREVNRGGNGNAGRGRGGPAGRGGGAAPAPKFEGDYDFDSANSELTKELEKLTVTTVGERGEGDGQEQVVPQEAPSSPGYKPGESFFDSISSEATDRAKGKRTNMGWREERKMNVETFGTQGRNGGGRRGGGYRGRGGYYGGGGGYSRGGQGYYRGGPRR